MSSVKFREKTRNTDGEVAGSNHHEGLGGFSRKRSQALECGGSRGNPSIEVILIFLVKMCMVNASIMSLEIDHDHLKAFKDPNLGLELYGERRSRLWCLRWNLGR